jgi:hypothetical protein
MFSSLLSLLLKSTASATVFTLALLSTMRADLASATFLTLALLSTMRADLASAAFLTEALLSTMRADLASAAFLTEALLSTVFTLRALAHGNQLAIHNRHQLTIVSVAGALQVCLKRRNWEMHEARHIVANDARP